MEMSAHSQEKPDWSCFKEGDKNCLIWPDLLPWGNKQEVEIERGNENNDLGVVSTVIQDPETKICYNIVKQIKGGKPALGKVECFDWIVAVDGKPTTNVKGSTELVDLARNGKDKVHLTIRKATDSLACIKEWSKERKVELKDHSKGLGFRLSHFYLKDRSGKTKDCILIFDINSEETTKSKTNRQLYRGDELLAVNGQRLTGKKLKDIYDLFSQPPTKTVVMDIKPIITRKELDEKLRKIALKSPDLIYWSQKEKEVGFNANESTLGFQILSNTRKNSLENEIFHIVGKVTEGTPAARANLPVGARLMSVNGHNLVCLEKTEAANLIKNQKGDLRLSVVAPEGLRPQHLRKKRSAMRKVSNSLTSEDDFVNTRPECDKSSQSQVNNTASSSLQPFNRTETGDGASQTGLFKNSQISKVMEQENEAYLSSDNQTNEDLCKSCKKKHKKGLLRRLPEDKQLWTLNKIETVTFDEICDMLDRNIINCDIRKLAAYMSFSPDEIRKTTQTYDVKGGIGAARDYLQKWSGDEKNNVESFKKILELDGVKRGDVINLINEWLQKDVCNGCGCLINVR